MILPNYLTAGSCNRADPALYLLGETGLTLPRSQRPSALLTAWMNCADIPGNARKVLEADSSFAGMTGLIRVPVERQGVHGIRVVWILARTVAGLTSIVVRDARSASEAQLHRDAAFAKEQASRYFARHAILLVQSRGQTENMGEFSKFSAVCGQSCPETDRLYGVQAESDIRLNYVWLAPLVLTEGF